MNQDNPVRFLYNSPFLKATFAVLGFSSLFFLSAPMAMFMFSPASPPFQVYILSGILSFGFLCGAIYTYLTSLPILVDNYGIATLFRGRRWRSIAWGQVKRIEKLRVYNSLFSRDQYIFRVNSETVRIDFSDWISNLPKLISIVNLNATKYNIPIYSFGEDEYSERKKGRSISSL